MMQQPQAHASALVVAPSASAVAPAVAHPQDPAGGDAPPKQVAQAMERLGRAGRLIADIRLGADRLLEALFVAGGAPPYSVHQHVDRMERVIVKEEAAMRLHFQDLRALGRQLEESGVLNGALKARGNSWGLHMPLVCPDGAVVAYAWKRQLAGQAGASAVDRTRLALKAFTDQKRRFFPHLEDEVLSHLHDGEPGVTKKPKLIASNGDLEEKSLSEILKNLENEVPNMKIFTYWHLDWSKRASSLASLMDDDFVDPSKELNLQNMGKSRSGALTTPIDQVAVIELLVPSIFRAVVSLHPAGSTDPDAVAFFSPTEGGSYLHARGTSVHHVFKHVKICLALHAFPGVGFCEPRVEIAVWQALKQTSPRSEKVGEINRMFLIMKEHADKALQYFISVEPSKALSLLLRWIASYQTLFTKQMRTASDDGQVLGFAIAACPPPLSPDF